MLHGSRDQNSRNRLAPRIDMMDATSAEDRHKAEAWYGRDDVGDQRVYV